MCFSATSSFAAAGALSITGLASLKLSPTKRFYWLAAIPLVFAVQQAVEGIVWLGLPTTNNPLLHHLASHIFLIFAFCVWPVWFPCSLACVEPNSEKKKQLHRILFLGIALSLFGAFVLLKSPLNTREFLDNLIYDLGHRNSVASNIYLILYLACTAGPFLISSLKLTKIYGLSVIAALVVTYLMMLKAFISVWCFFAAILSLLIILIIIKNRHLKPTA